MALSKVNPNLITQGASRKNLIINGAMQVAQRGTTGTLNNGGSGFHSADRFYSAEEGGFTGAFTVSNDTDSPKGFSNSTKWECTTADTSLAADDTFFMDYKPEAQDLQHLNYGTSDALQMTMSFWIKSNKTGTYVIWLYQYDDNRHVQMQYTINTADTWEYKTLLVPADTTGVIDNDTGAGLALRFIMGAGSTWTSGTAPTTWASLVTANRYVGQTVNLADSTANYMNITGLQLETGSVATDFEHRSFGEELALCQRYYSRTTALSGLSGCVVFYAFDSNESWGGVFFPVTMRTTPTITVYNNAGTSGGIHRIGSPDLTGVTVNRISTTGFSQIVKNGALLADDIYACTYTAESEL